MELWGKRCQGEVRTQRALELTEDLGGGAFRDWEVEGRHMVWQVVEKEGG